MGEEKIAGRRIAKESDRIKRARQKLLARWDEENRLMSQEAIDKIKEKIKSQYHRNTKLRTPILETGKPLRLFAQGEGVQMTAGPRVKAVLDRVIQELQQNKEAVDRHLLLSQTEECSK